MNYLPDGTRKYADLLTIVKAGLAAQGRPADEDDAYGEVDDLVQGLLAYAAAMDIVEKDAGGADGVPVAAHRKQARQAAKRYWHQSNTVSVLDSATRFAEGFVNGG